MDLLRYLVRSRWTMPSVELTGGSDGLSQATDSVSQWTGHNQLAVRDGYTTDAFLTTRNASISLVNSWQLYRQSSGLRVIRFVQATSLWELDFAHIVTL